MKLWVDGKEGSPGRAVRLTLAEQVEVINRKVTSRGVRAVNALHNAELNVLSGQRSGKVYKVPGTYGSKMTKATRKLLKDYGHKLRGGQLYRASAPNEAPARRLGNLRLHWNGQVKKKESNKKVEVIAELECQEEYADYLENGKGMAPRPFVDRIKKKAEPEIKKIYSSSYQ